MVVDYDISPEFKCDDETIGLSPIHGNHKDETDPVLDYKYPGQDNQPFPQFDFAFIQRASIICYIDHSAQADCNTARGSLRISL